MRVELGGTLPTFFAETVFSPGLIVVVIGGAELLTGSMALLPLAAFKGWFDSIAAPRTSRPHSPASVPGIGGLCPADPPR